MQANVGEQADGRLGSGIGAAHAAVNRRFAIERAKDKETVRRILAYGGIPAELEAEGGSSRTLAQRYRVLGLYPDPLRVWRLRPAVGATWEPLREDDAAFGKAGRLGVRALYALGLDAGTVELVQRGERLCVAGVDGASAERDPLVREAALATRAASAAATGRALLGADPEFILARANGAVVKASRYLPPKGRVGSDAMRIRGRVLWPIAELRPEPAVEPEQLFRRLRQALVAAGELVLDQDVRWLAGSMPRPGFPLGGHVHVSGLPVTPELVRALDNYLALPLALLEEPPEPRRRRRPLYGWLGDVRRQPHGGFEYRTLPSWLVAPRFAKGTLAVLRAVADHHAALALRPLDDPEAIRAFYESDKSALRPHAERVWDDLERLPGVEPYARLWAPMREQSLALRPWREDADFRPRWKMRAAASASDSSKR